MNSRWLTLGPAVERLLEQWNAVQEYFFKCIPLKTQNQVNSNSYQKVISILKQKTIKAELYFLLSSINIFTKYTNFFQKEEPLIHSVYNHLKELVFTICGRICKHDVIKSLKNNMSSLDNPFELESLMPLKDTVFNENLKKELLSLAEKDRTVFLHCIQKHFISAGKYLMQNDNVLNKNLKYARCLHPKGRTEKSTIKDLIKFASAIPINNINLDLLTDEWTLVQLEDEVKEKPSRADKY